MSDRYATFSLPQNQSDCATAQLMLNAAIGMRNRLEALPDNKNRTEAILLLDRSVMVAMGAFRVGR